MTSFQSCILKIHSSRKQALISCRVPGVWDTAVDSAAPVELTASGRRLTPHQEPQLCCLPCFSCESQQYLGSFLQIC